MSIIIPLLNRSSSSGGGTGSGSGSGGGTGGLSASPSSAAQSEAYLACLLEHEDILLGPYQNTPQPLCVAFPTLELFTSTARDSDGKQLCPSVPFPACAVAGGWVSRAVQSEGAVLSCLALCGSTDSASSSPVVAGGGQPYGFSVGAAAGGGAGSLQAAVAEAATLAAAAAARQQEAGREQVAAAAAAPTAAGRSPSSASFLPPRSSKSFSALPRKGQQLQLQAAFDMEDPAPAAAAPPPPVQAGSALTRAAALPANCVLCRTSLSTASAPPASASRPSPAAAAPSSSSAPLPGFASLFGGPAISSSPAKFAFSAFSASPRQQHFGLSAFAAPAPQHAPVEGHVVCCRCGEAYHLACAGLSAAAAKWKCGKCWGGGGR